jgi:peptidoglycan/LPS O-acetylase OafA/YrhL
LSQGGADTYRKLEALRGVAACAVALHHSPFMLKAEPAAFVASSYLFVDFFFILSGFVMTHVYRDRITQGLPFKNYLLLRLGRLYPLHVFAHLLYALSVFGKWLLYAAGVGASNPAQALPLGSFWTNLLLLQGFGAYGYLYWNRPSWSIGAELGVYVIFFVFTATLDRRGRLLPPLVFALLLYGALLVHDERRLDITYDFGLLRCIAGFYLGSCLLRLSRRWGARLRLARGAQAGAELACVAAVIWCVSNAASSQLSLPGALLAFAASIYVFSRDTSGPLGALLKTPWLGKLGIWSYSIYLLHLVCFEVAGDVAEYVLGMKLQPGIGPIAILLNALVIAFVIALSRYTYEWIEEPFRERVKARVAARLTSTSDAPARDVSAA